MPGDTSAEMETGECFLLFTPALAARVDRGEFVLRILVGTRVLVCITLKSFWN